MTIEEILTEWKNDTKINDLTLDTESLKIPNLHAKYLEELSETRIKLKMLKLNRYKIVLSLTDYYRGLMNNKEDLQKLNREPFRQKIARSETDLYVNSDEILNKHDQKIIYLEEKEAILIEILKSLDKRGYLIKSAIDFHKFTMGA